MAKRYAVSERDYNRHGWTWMYCGRVDSVEEAQERFGSAENKDMRGFFGYRVKDKETNEILFVKEYEDRMKPYAEHRDKIAREHNEKNRIS